MASHKFNKIGIISRPGNNQPAAVLESLIRVFKPHNISLFMDETVPESVRGKYPLVTPEEMTDKVDVVIVVGGDGTLLHASRSLVDNKIPIIGVNVGRLGFLVDISPKQITKTFNTILNGHYQVEERILLHAKVIRENKVLFQGIALNDVSIHVRDTIRMIEFETRIDDKFVSLQRADGLVVATPTGSTAYSLSSGGPIVHPGLDTFTLVPICPHTLTSRPIVVSAQSNITVNQVTNTETQARIALDGQDTFNLKPGDSIQMKRHSNKLKLIHPDDYDYFQILRKKLRWSEQP